MTNATIERQVELKGNKYRVVNDSGIVIRLMCQGDEMRVLEGLSQKKAASAMAFVNNRNVVNGEIELSHEELNDSNVQYILVER